MKQITDMLCIAFMTLVYGFIAAMAIWGVLAVIACLISAIT